MNQRCIFCNKKLSKDEEELCETCSKFFDWKYKGKRKNGLVCLREELRKKKGGANEK